MIDIQNQEDSRNIAIDRVGVKNLSYPVTVLDRKKKTQQTIGSINMYVNLPHHFRGTHMSRFVEILNEHHCDLHIEKIGRKHRWRCVSPTLSKRKPLFREHGVSWSTDAPTWDD